MRNIICGIYKITSPTERVYVGQSKDITRRWKSYKNKAKGNEKQWVLGNSFLKYGVENHTFEIIEECLEEDLNCRERYWQDFYDVLNGGLNLVLQECGEKRRILTDEQLKKMSIRMSGKNSPMYGKEGGFKGKKHSEETKKEASKKMKGRYDGELNPFFGKEHTEEIKNILSERAKEKVGDKNPFYGRNHTDEYKKQSSERTSNFFKDNDKAKQHLKNILSTGTYYTPNGAFISQRDAAKSNNVSRSTIINRCIKNTDKRVGYNYNIPEVFKGEKTWKEQGWFFMEKSKTNMSECSSCEA
jgi:group I intron endonuclease